MKGLLIKDFKLLSAQKSYYLILILLAAGTAYFSQNIAMIYTFLCMILPMFAVSSISYDQFDNGSSFLFTLPITRRGYVWEKYVFALLLESIALALATLLALGIVGALGGDSDAAWVLSDLLVMIPVIGAAVLIILSLMIPVNLKYGSEKGRVALFIVVGGIVAISLLVGRLVQMAGGQPLALTTLFEKLERAGMRVLVFAVLALAAAVCGVSVLISQRIIKKKEY